MSTSVTRMPFLFFSIIFFIITIDIFCYCAHQKTRIIIMIHNKLKTTSAINSKASHSMYNPNVESKMRGIELHNIFIKFSWLVHVNQYPIPSFFLFSLFYFYLL
jgi:hypothetical protein